MDSDRGDRGSDRVPPDSSQDEDVYTKNEEGEPRMAGRASQDGGDNGVYGMYSDSSLNLMDSKIYGFVLLVGAALLVFPDPLTSMLGVVLLLIGGFLAFTDVLSA